LRVCVETHIHARPQQLKQEVGELKLQLNQSKRNISRLQLHEVFRIDVLLA
jgi:hypothetical protein